MKLLILFPNFGPYHMARLRGAAAQAEFSPCIGLEIAAQEALYPWQTERENLGFQLDTLLDGTLEELPARAINAQLDAYLNQSQPDVIAICGYERAEMRAALKWANKNKKIAVIMSESKRDDAPRKAWKEAIKKRIVRRFDAGLVGGAAHKDYLIELGIPAQNIFDGYDVVDNAAFAALADKWRTEPRLIERPYFLTVNRFIERKNLTRVIQAWKDYRAQVRRNFLNQTAWDLVLCGAGDEENNLREQAVDLEGVHFTGFAQQDEIARYMAGAGAFIHASLQEQWGLVVNEAMACGLPILLSQTCGCAPELLRNGRNGYAFDPTQTDNLAERMTYLAHEISDERRAEMGAASREIIASWEPSRFGAGLLKCARAAGAT